LTYSPLGIFETLVQKLRISALHKEVANACLCNCSRAIVSPSVSSLRRLLFSPSEPTFLNLDAPYPRQVFTVVIWGSDRPKFSAPEEKYRGKQICVTGQIKEFRGVPEIVAYEPAQIKTQGAGK